MAILTERAAICLPSGVVSLPANSCSSFSDFLEQEEIDTCRIVIEKSSNNRGVLTQFLKSLMLFIVSSKQSKSNKKANADRNTVFSMTYTPFSLTPNYSESTVLVCKKIKQLLTFEDEQFVLNHISDTP